MAEVVKTLLLEISGNPEKLRAAIDEAKRKIEELGGKAKAVPKEIGASADAMAGKFGIAARGAASAFETIARTGKASGEAMKQLIAQGANAAVFFGPYGALVGAIGISTIALADMFRRAKQELAELEERSVSAMNAFVELDSKGMQSQITRLAVGDPFKQSLSTIFAQDDKSKRRDALLGRGRDTLGEDIARLQAERADAAAKRMRISTNAAGQSVTSDDVRVAELTEQINELTAVRKEASDRLATMVELSQKAAQQEAALKAVTEASKAATKGATEVENERTAGLRELATESERLAERSRKLIADTLGGTAERVAAPFDEAINDALQKMTDGVDVATNSALIPNLEEARDAAVLVATSLEGIATVLFGIEERSSRGLKPTITDFGALELQIQSTEAALSQLDRKTEGYRKLNEQLIKLQKERRSVAAAIVARELGIDGDDPKKPKKDVRDMADYARELQQAADGALQLAQNLGGASDSLVSMLRSVVQVAGNLPALSKAIDAGGAMGIISAGLPILGALSSMFGKSPEERQRAQELRENTQAIRDWTTKVGALGGVDVSGSDATGAAGGLRPFLRRFAGNGLLPARSAAQAAGLDLAALDRIAASLGITLNDNIQSFEQLAKQLTATTDKLGEFGDDLDSQRRQAEAEIALYGVTDPLERLRIRQRATGGRSSALDGVTAGLDLSTAEGREQARRNAQALFDVMRSGGGTLGAGELGGLTGDELLQALLDLIDGLRDVEGAVGTAAGGSVVGGVSGYSGLTAAAGARLEDYNRALVTYARDAQVTRLDMLARLDQLAQHLVGPIPVPPMGALGGARSGGVQIQIGPGAFVLQFSISSDSRDDVLSAIGDGIERVTTDALYRGILQARIVAGDLRVAS